jgi:hypothetical protein
VCIYIGIQIGRDGDDGLDQASAHDVVMISLEGTERIRVLDRDSAIRISDSIG